MFPEVGKPRITEIQVRIDCNGCVQKIKKALHGINGIYDLYIDLPQQKLIVVGWADPEKIVKAIKKTRKVATICSHTEAPPDPPPQPADPPPPDQAAPPPGPDVPPPEPAPPPQEPTPPPAEPPNNPPPPQPENPPPDATPPPPNADPSANQPPPGPPQGSGPKDVEEIHVIHHHPPEFGNSSYSTSTANYTWPNQPPNNYYSNGYFPINNSNSYPINGRAHVYRVIEPSVHVAHSYNTYRPSPHISEYQYMAPTPQHTQYHHHHYNRADYDHHSYHYRTSANGEGNITSMFSDENPNACRIM
ncbi:hypothetical protein Sjap_007380 [Stephania japonica]|uniref:HMA domain-containing protein n=1 Tax=Stephania japonica TaxID=461633 RepID=A0AAP0JNG3_9MAGN